MEFDGMRSAAATVRGRTVPARRRRPKGVDAARQHSNHDDRVWEGYDRQQETSTQQRRANGPESGAEGNRRALSSRRSEPQKLATG